MINNKYVDEKDDFFMEEPAKNLSGILRNDFELFDEDKYVPNDVLTVKRVSLPKNGENWDILKNKKKVLTIKGIRFSKKERSFLRTPEGIFFLLNGYKAGWRSVSEFKRRIKNEIR